MKRRCALLLIVAVSSCETREPAEPPPRPTLVFELQTTERTLEGCHAGAPGCSFIRFDHPVVKAHADQLTPGAESITEAVLTFLSQPIRPGEEPATPRELFDQFMAELEATGDAAPRFVERKVFVLYNTPRIVSLSFGERSLLGGAQAADTYRLASFDVASGKQLRLTDAVPAAKHEELRLIAEARFREVRNLEPNVDLAETGFRFTEGRFTLTENFALDDEGMSFYYNADEIAARSEGPTEVKLGYDELRGLLGPILTEGR